MKHQKLALFDKSTFFNTHSSFLVQNLRVKKIARGHCLLFGAIYAVILHRRNILLLVCVQHSEECFGISKPTGALLLSKFLAKILRVNKLP